MKSILFDEFQLKTSVEAIEARMPFRPRVALVLGSGWSGVKDLLQSPTTVALSEIPHFPLPSVSGHGGHLLFGQLDGCPVVILSGRKHLYEGAGLGAVVYPVEVFQRLGIKILGLTNAAGSANPEFEIGDLMILRDHFDSTWHRYTAPMAESTGTRGALGGTPVYDSEYVERLLEIGQQEGLPVRCGVYAFTLGPFYESPGEVRCLGNWQADALGMSTVPEALYARLRGMRVFALSGITNLGTGLAAKPHSHESVKEQAGLLAPRATLLLRRFVSSLE